MYVCMYVCMYIYIYIYIYTYIHTYIHTCLTASAEDGPPARGSSPGAAAGAWRVERARAGAKIGG